jgi:glycogenin glucosyltransferase
MMETAYVTTLCNGDGYVPGVEALGQSLDRTGTKHPKVVLITPDVPESARQLLSSQGWWIRDIEPIENPNEQAQRLFARFANTFTKLRAFNLTEFSKVVLLDADTIAIQNIDELFERPGPAAAPDFLLPDHFNSGVMVVDPSEDTFNRMMEQLFVSGSYDGGDQGFLNSFYPDWYSLPAGHRLPSGYNMHHFIYQFLRAYPGLAQHVEGKAKIIHYTVQKPWRSKPTLTGGSEQWWGMYFDAHPESAKGWKRHLHAFEDWSFDHAMRALLG